MAASSITKKIRVILEMIKIEHALFALPFLYSGAILASEGIPSKHVLFWITVGILSARPAAMSLNRLIDKDIDARNPRTKDRALPKGLIGEKEVVAMIVLCLGVLFLAAFKLNYTCVKLYPLAVAIFIVYPFLKRYTWFSHIVLGSALGMAPVGGWAAVTDSVPLPALVLGGAVTFWTAGFDVIYSLQDIEFDRKLGLYSIPALWGVERALLSSSILHAFTIALLFTLFLMLKLGFVFLVGMLIILGLLVYEHSIINPNDLGKVEVAFFNVNAIVGAALFLFILLDTMFPIRVI